MPAAYRSMKTPATRLRKTRQIRSIRGRLLDSPSTSSPGFPSRRNCSSGWCRVGIRYSSRQSKDHPPGRMTAEQGRPDLPCPNRVDVRIGFIRLEAVFDMTVPYVSIGNRSRSWMVGLVPCCRGKRFANLPEFGIDHFVTAARYFSQFPARFYGDRARSVADQAR